MSDDEHGCAYYAFMAVVLTVVLAWWVFMGVAAIHFVIKWW